MKLQYHENRSKCVSEGISCMIGQVKLGVIKRKLVHVTEYFGMNNQVAEL